MNAIEFVKHRGIEYTKGIIIGCESGLLPKNNNYADLKQIVDAWELIEAWGGLEDAKLYDLSHCKSKPDSMGYKLMKAINLVEQCL